MADRKGRRFDAVVHTQLVEDIAHMELDGRQTDAQLGSDLLVVQAPRHPFEHLLFPAG